jgi:phosphatidylinositol-4,5-bisphosphate 3-kinase catalytic subunit alpha/beta/delta
VAIDIQQKEGMQVVGGVPVPNPGAAQRRAVLLKNHLSLMNLPAEFSFPFNTSVRVLGGRAAGDHFGVIGDKCRVMDSAKSPLWLTFRNSDPCHNRFTQVLFKAGDDLRQDMLTIQMFRIMDKAWKSQGLDLGMSLYNCMVTGGSHVGLVEIVENCNTFANIQKERGKRGVFKDRALWMWLVKEPRTNGLSDETLRENFLLSTAAYCVATYILGIGDRHNDNIMLTKTGQLLHIDFGHFLGHIKKVAGVINRERAPFVFTPEMFFVISQTKVKNAQKVAKGSASQETLAADFPEFHRFIDLCARAYNILRLRGATFISLFAMMLSTGIPELKSFSDIEYLRKSFSMEEPEREATARFQKMILSSLGAKSTQINFFLHNLAH